jgi:hypothetical protein
MPSFNRLLTCILPEIHMSSFEQQSKRFAQQCWQSSTFCPSMLHPSSVHSGDMVIVSQMAMHVRALQPLQHYKIFNFMWFWN